ncbi:hypothetical protein LshimejAT787_0702340 [Lyophyllum shimeji]|uniref:F-box domain-containing protein n=1 Tax=Lyophyllum shimeji TaxID=47721 RepID=A0A9P3PQH4_LYOSH|nr:hypothetical protein LshimejAT787_0702340 [Lyophyllum shimeji]
MTVFTDLPIDILPLVVSHLIKPHHLASSCLVNRAFHQFTVPRLYERASIYAWQREGKTKVVQLFTTLAQCPHLAKYVRRLDIREFPKAITLAELGETVLRGLRNCTNLRACTWTRDGSLTSGILQALQTSGTLQELEINGRCENNYDPALLQGFTQLSRVVLIMPSAPVVGRLCPWMRLTGGTLQSLTLICKASHIVTDAVLESLAPHLVNLRHLYLTGCSKVTHDGVWSILSGNTVGLLELGLEGLSTHFNMEKFAWRCLKAGTLSKLTSITLTVHPQLPLDVWMNDVLTLLSAAPLRNFHIYSTGAFYESPSTEPFWSQLVATHGPRLLRFSVHRMLISLKSIEDICRRCTNLQQLFIVVEPESLQSLGACLAHAKSLHSIHINYPMEAHADAVPVMLVDEALTIIRQCSSTLTQFGCNARVWQVSRMITLDPDGTYQAHPKLSPYESPDIPEPFLVVRT